MAYEIPVYIEREDFKVIGPIVDYVHPKEIHTYVTSCSIVFHLGYDDKPVKENLSGQTWEHQVLGQSVVTNPLTFDEDTQKIKAREAAVNQLQQLGFVVK